MIELLIDSLTINSIGLLVLGLGILITHFWNKRKLSRDSNVVVIEGIGESVFSKLFKARSLVAGVILLIGGTSLILFNYNQRMAASYIQIIEETYALVMDKPMLTAHGKKAVEKLESTIPLSFLNKKITSEIDNWYASRNDLSTMNEGKPVCIKLYEMYERVGDEETTIKFDQIYQEFLKSFFGEVNYFKIINDREENWERVKWSRMSPIEKSQYLREQRLKEREDRIRRGR